MATTIKHKSALAVANEKATAKATDEPKAPSTDVISRLRDSREEAAAMAQRVDELYWGAIIRVASDSPQPDDASKLEAIAEDRELTPEQVEKDIAEFRRFFELQQRVLSPAERDEIALRRAELWQDRIDFEKRVEAELRAIRIPIAECDDAMMKSGRAVANLRQFAKRFPQLLELPEDGNLPPVLKVDLA